MNDVQVDDLFRLISIGLYLFGSLLLILGVIPHQVAEIGEHENGLAILRRRYLRLMVLYCVLAAPSIAVLVLRILDCPHEWLLASLSLSGGIAYLVGCFTFKLVYKFRKKEGQQ